MHRTGRTARWIGWAWALVGVGAALIVLDVLTVFRSPMYSTYSPSWVGGFDVSLTGGCVWVRTGNGFERTGEVHLYPRQERRWWFSTDWYSLSGRLNWRETYVPLWCAWGPLVVAGAFVGPGRAAWRRRHGLCARCGYERAGLVEAVVCPECGTGGAARG